MIRKRNYNEAIGRILVTGFEGVSLPDHLRAWISKGRLGGLVFFKRNIESPSQVAAVIQEAKAIAPPGREPLFCIDQEGGRVVRIRHPLTVLPPARVFGTVNDISLTERAGMLVGSELRSLGFTLNFAPVLDLDTNPNSPVIGDRSYSSDGNRVIAHGLAFARGLRSGGVLPCAKHFPGHGDAVQDSHLALPRISHDKNTLLHREMKPFEKWVAANVGPIMTAHIVFEALDPHLPATLSRKVIADQLRNRFGFQGVVFSDDMEMGAVTEFSEICEAAQMAVRAGVNGLLVCRREEVQMRTLEGLEKAAHKDEQLATALSDSIQKMTALKVPSLSNLGPDWIGSSKHASYQSEIMSQLEKKVP